MWKVGASLREREKKKEYPGKRFCINPLLQENSPLWRDQKASWFPEGVQCATRQKLEGHQHSTSLREKKKKLFHDGAAYTRHNADFLKTPKPTSTTNERSLRSRIDAELLWFLDLNFFGSAGKTSHFRGCHQVATCDKRVPTRTNGDGKPSPSSPASRLQHEHLTFQPSPSSGNTRQLQNEPLVDAVECDAGVMTQWNETNVDTI